MQSPHLAGSSARSHPPFRNIRWRRCTLLFRRRGHEPTPLEPNAYREARMKVVIDARMRRPPSPCRTRCKRRTGGMSACRFALRISALFTIPSQIDESVCPPRCIGQVPQPSCNRTEKFCSGRYPIRGDRADSAAAHRPASQGFDRGTHVSVRRTRQLGSGTDRTPGYQWFATDILGMLRGGGLDPMQAAAERDGGVGPRFHPIQPTAPRMRPFVNSSCQQFRTRSSYSLIAHIAFSGAWRPETGFDRKAGDCFGFSPSFTEWIFVVAGCRRFRVGPAAFAQRRPHPGSGSG